MKTIIFLGLALCVASANMTMKKYEECVDQKEVEGASCDSDCKLEIEDNCMYDTEVFNNVDCKYWYRNIEIREDKEWSEDMGIAFHSCWDLCIEELGGQAKEYVEMQKDCGSNVLSATLIAFLFIVGVLI